MRSTTQTWDSSSKTQVIQTRPSDFLPFFQFFSSFCLYLPLRFSLTRFLVHLPYTLASISSLFIFIRQPPLSPHFIHLFFRIFPGLRVNENWRKNGDIYPTKSHCIKPLDSLRATLPDGDESSETKGKTKIVIGRAWTSKHTQKVSKRHSELSYGGSINQIARITQIHTGASNEIKLLSQARTPSDIALGKPIVTW